MILIVAAIKAELLPLVEHLKVDQKEMIGQGTLYFSDKTHLLRTGVGMQKAEEALSAYLEKYQPEKIINVGTAGSLNSDFSVGLITEPVRIRNEREEEINPIPLFQNQSLFKKSILLTVNDAVQNQKQKKKLFNQFSADIVDMEAFALAKLSRQHNIDFHCIKIISDHADEHTIDDFKNNYKIIIEKISGHLINYLNLSL